MSRKRAVKPRFTPEEHRQQVAAVHGDRLRPVDDYAGAHTKIRYECPIHGTFSATPANVVHRKSGCSLCYHESHVGRDRKSHKTYVAEARALGVEVLDPYETSHTPIRHRCNKKHIWETKPNQLLSGYGCPLCDQSQYKRRPIQVGERLVMVQGSEGRAVQILLEDEAADPSDLAFTKREGRPTFRYRFDGRWRVYIPDVFRISLDQVIEVKSAITFGVYDRDIYAKVRAKARATIRAGHKFRLMVIHRNQLIDLGQGWHRLAWPNIVERFKRRSHAKDRRLGRNRPTKP